MPSCLAAVRHVTEPRDMSAIAERTGRGRESICKGLAPRAKPRYARVLKVFHSLIPGHGKQRGTGTNAHTKILTCGLEV